MKSKLNYLLITAFICAGLFTSCREQNTVASYQSFITYNSFEDFGCTHEVSLGKINDDAIMNWEYSNNTLHLEFLFYSLCSAVCEDSVVISENTIQIFLTDTSDYAARCICQLREVFNFIVLAQNQIRILFHFKAYAADKYFLLIDQTIDL